MRSRLDYGAWISYVIERFTGLEEQGAQGAWGAKSAESALGGEGAIKPGSHKIPAATDQAFPDVYADDPIARCTPAALVQWAGPSSAPSLTAGHDRLKADIDKRAEIALLFRLKAGKPRIPTLWLPLQAGGTLS
jgi:hypothetical protein